MGYPVCSFTETLKNFVKMKAKVLHLNVWQHELFKYDQLLGLTGYSRVKMTEDTNILTIHPTCAHTRTPTHTETHTGPCILSISQCHSKRPVARIQGLCFLLDQSKEEKYNFLIKLSLSCHFTASDLPCPLL